MRVRGSDSKTQSGPSPKYGIFSEYLQQSQTMSALTSHKCNTPGDFYVEDGCCTQCAMPFEVAPNLFAWAEDNHCYVQKQPQTPAELEQMIAAIEVADLSCIRYKGNQRVIQIRLIEMHAGGECDDLPPELARRTSELKAKRTAALKAKDLEGKSAWQRILYWMRGSE